MEGEPAGGHLMLGQTTELAASFARSTIPGEDATERAACAKARPLVEQSRSGFGRRQIDEPRLARRVEDCGALHSLSARAGSGFVRDGRGDAVRRSVEGPRLPLTAPVGEQGRQDPLTAQHRSDLARLRRTVGFSQDAQLFLCSEAAAA